MTPETEDQIYRLASMKSPTKLMAEAMYGNSLLAKIGVLHKYTIVDHPASGTVQVIERVLDPRRFEWLHLVIGSFPGVDEAMVTIRSLVIAQAQGATRMQPQSACDYQ